MEPKLKKPNMQNSKINDALAEFKKNYAETFSNTLKNLVSLGETMITKEDHLFLNTAAFFNILFPLKNLFENEDFQMLCTQMQTEMQGGHLGSKLKDLEKKIEEIFSEKWIVFIQQSPKARPHSENIFYVSNNNKISLIALHTKKSIDAEQAEAKQKVKEHIPDQRLFTSICIENVLGELNATIN